MKAIIFLLDKTKFTLYKKKFNLAPIKILKRERQLNPSPALGLTLWPVHCDNILHYVFCPNYATKKTCLF